MALQFKRTPEGQTAKSNGTIYEVIRHTNCRSSFWFVLYVNGTRVSNNREATMRACKKRANRVEDLRDLQNEIKEYLTISPNLR